MLRVIIVGVGGKICHCLEHCCTCLCYCTRYQVHHMICIISRSRGQNTQKKKKLGKEKALDTIHPTSSILTICSTRYLTAAAAVVYIDAIVPLIPPYDFRLVVTCAEIFFSVFFILIYLRPLSFSLPPSCRRNSDPSLLQHCGWCHVRLYRQARSSDRRICSASFQFFQPS